MYAQTILTNLRSPLTLLATGLALMFLAGCGEPEKRLQSEVEASVAIAKAGNPTEAIARLEALESKHPNQPAVSEGLAIAFEEKGSYLIASNYYQKSSRISPTRRNLLLDSARNLLRANRTEDAARRFGEYLEHFPNDGESWLQLGRLHAQLGARASAQEALSRGILLVEPEVDTVADQQLLGELYLEDHDFPQADYYLNQALQSAQGTDHEYAILFALARSSVGQQDWDVAQVFLRQIDRLIGENAASFELLALKDTVQVALKPSVPAVDQAEIPTIRIDGEPDLTTADTQASDNPYGYVVQAEDEHNKDRHTSHEANTERPDSWQGSSEALSDALGQQSPSTLADQAEQAPEAEQKAGIPVEASVQLLRDGQQHILDGNYTEAIRTIWDSINQKPDQAGAWFLLSHAYALHGQYLNAESAALESIRLHPRSKTIALNYLSIIQKSREASRFHDELLRLYHIFSDEPDFVLAMARSYARIKQDADTAMVLYRRFLDMAPDHAQAVAARDELSLVE